MGIVVPLWFGNIDIVRNPVSIHLVDKIECGRLRTYRPVLNQRRVGFAFEVPMLNDRLSKRFERGVNVIAVDTQNTGVRLP